MAARFTEMQIVIPPVLQIVVQHARCGRIAPPLCKSDDLEDADGTIKPDRQHVAGLHGMAGRLLAHAIDADVAGLDQRGSAGAAFTTARATTTYRDAGAPSNTNSRTDRTRDPLVLSSITQQTKSLIRKKRGLLCAITVIRLRIMR